MISVVRGVEPEGFMARAAAWNRRYQEARGEDPKLTASKFWNRVRRELKEDADILRERFQEKCAFCEAKMAHVSNPQIEHYRPKSRLEFTSLMFAWDNWLLSCGRCNQDKWTKFPQCGGRPCLLDPTVDDPPVHLEFTRAYVSGISELARETIVLVGLLRAPLKNDRASWLCRIDALLLLAGTSPVADVKTESRSLLIWAMQSDAPYTAMTRAYLQSKVPLLANPATPHPRVAESNQIERVNALVEAHAAEIRRLE